MSAGLGVYAAIPGGGSLESNDISLMRRALVAGFIGMVKSCAIDVEWYGKEIAYCHCLHRSLKTGKSWEEGFAPEEF